MGYSMHGKHHDQYESNFEFLNWTVVEVNLCGATSVVVVVKKSIISKLD